jgi:hypothetical protein
LMSPDRHLFSANKLHRDVVPKVHEPRPAQERSCGRTRPLSKIKRGHAFLPC